MPAILRPGEQFEIWLDGDADIVPRPTFFATAVSAGAMIEFNRSLRNISEANDKIEVFENMFCILDKCIIGWENMSGRNFSLDEMRRILTIPEGMELIKKVMDANRLSEDERKKSVSQR